MRHSVSMSFYTVLLISAGTIGFVLFDIETHNRLLLITYTSICLCPNVCFDGKNMRIHSNNCYSFNQFYNQWMQNKCQLYPYNLFYGTATFALFSYGGLFIWPVLLSGSYMHYRELPMQSVWNGVHDDVIKWKHFLRYWPFAWGIHWSPVNYPHKDQWRGALISSLICARINGWVNNRAAGDLRCHRAYYDVIVMISIYLEYRCEAYLPTYRDITKIPFHCLLCLRNCSIYISSDML